MAIVMVADGSFYRESPLGSGLSLRGCRNDTHTLSKTLHPLRGACEPVTLGDRTSSVPPQHPNCHVINFVWVLLDSVSDLVNL